MKRLTKRVIAVCMVTVMLFGTAIPTYATSTTATESETTNTSYSLTFDDATDYSEFTGSGWAVADGAFKANATWSTMQLAKLLPLNEAITVSFDFYIDYTGEHATSLLGFGFMNSDLNSGTFGWVQRTTYGDLLTWRSDGVNGPTVESNPYIGDMIVRTTSQIETSDSAFGSVHTVKIEFKNGNMTVYVDDVQMSCTNGTTVTCDITEGYFTLLATNTSAYIDNLTIEGLTSEEEDSGNDEETETTEADEMFGNYDCIIKMTDTKSVTTDSNGSFSSGIQLIYWTGNMTGAEYIAYDVENNMGGTALVGAEILLNRAGNRDTTYGGLWTPAEGLKCYLIDNSTGEVSETKMSSTGYYNRGGVPIPDGFQGTVVFPVESFERSAERHGYKLDGYTSSYDAMRLNEVFRFDTMAYKVSGQTYTASSTLTTSNVRIYGRNLSSVNLSANRAIQAIRDIGNVTVASESLILFARETYDALTTEQQAQVTNYDILLTAESEFAELNDYSGYIGTDGKDFTDTTGVTFEEVFDSAPSTVSAWIKVDKDVLDETHIGTIAGTLDKGGSGSGNTQGLYEKWNTFNFEVTTNGNLQVIWRVSKTVKAVFLVDNVDVRTGKWMHVAFTRDAENNKLCVYVNGVLAQEKEVYDGTIADITMTKSVMIGSDYNDNNVLAIGENPVFKGCIAGVNVYSTTLSEEEIMTDITGELETELLGSVDFKSGEDGAYFNAVGEDVVDAYGWLEVSDDYFKAEDDEFTLAVLPDTQMLLSMARDGSNRTLYGATYDYETSTYTSTYDYTTNSFYKNIQWLIENKDSMNLQYVLHVGDLTDNGNNTKTQSYKYTDAEGTEQTITKLKYAWEYEFGLDWMDDLIENDIPYALARGNHETKANFQEYYTAEEYGQYTMDDFTITNEDESETTITGMHSSDSMLNVAYTFETCGQKYLIVTLDLETTDEAVAWANQLIASMPEYRTIILTHKYMTASGNLDASLLSGGVNSGQLLWDNLVSLHENIIMVINGHASGTNIVSRTDTGVNGNTVYQYMIDESHMGYYGSTQPGTFALLKFSDGGDTIKFNFYSASEGKLFRSMNQFTVNLTADEYSCNDYINKNSMVSTEMPYIQSFGYANESTGNYGNMQVVSGAGTDNAAICSNQFGLKTRNYGFVFALDIEKDGVFTFDETAYISPNSSAWVDFGVYLIDGNTNEHLRAFPKSSDVSGSRTQNKEVSYVIKGTTTYLSSLVPAIRVNEGDKIYIYFRAGCNGRASISGSITEDNGTITSYDAISNVMNTASSASSKVVLGLYNAGWNQKNADGTPINYNQWTVGWFDIASTTNYASYLYTLTVQDTDELVISSKSAPAYTVLPELGKTGHVFLGYVIDDELYPAGYTLNLTSDKTITAVFVDFTTFNSASVRMDEPAGLRFSTQMNDEDYSYLKDTLGLDIQLGSYIAMASSITTDGKIDYALLHADSEFTTINVKSTVQISAKNGYLQFNSVVVGLSESLYNSKFVGRGYMTVMFADGSSQTFYAMVDDNSRSVAEVASKAVADISKLQTKDYLYSVEGGYSPYSETCLAVLNVFASLLEEE